MSDQVKKLAPVILEEIKKADKILLHCHPNPDPDSIGSALAMMQVLRRMGKKVTVIAGDSPKPKSLSFFPGFDQIVAKNYFEIGPENFDLFIIQDSGAVGLVSSLKEVEFPDSLSTIVIDHHRTNTGFGKINLIDSTYPAVCQLLFDLFAAWDVKIDADMAVCLFIGMYADTGGFKFASVTPDTFLIASELVQVNPDFWKFIFQLQNSNDQYFIRFRGLALSNVKTFFEAQVAISAISLAEIEKNAIPLDNIRGSDISSELITVIGWKIGISLIEKAKGLCRLSIRSRDETIFDVSLLAEALGGGGHKGAAGASLNKPLSQAIELLLETIQKVYPQLGRP